MATANKTTTRSDTKAGQQAPANNLPATTQSQPEKKVPAIVQIKSYIDERMGELAFALPAHISPERFQRVLLTALQRNHKLLACTKQSLWNACLLAAQDGLLPDGREGAIVPYGENADGKKQADVATWMPMIEGLRKKARNSGEISDWLAFTVNARDQFDVILGDSPRISHKPYMGSEEPGEIIAAYSIAWLKDGTISRDVMTIRDILKIRAKSRANRGPWGDPTFFPEMCKKTVARRHYKQLPHSSDLDDMMKRDDEAFGLEDRSAEQIEQRQARRLGSTSAAFDRFAGGPAGSMIEHRQEDEQDHDEETSTAFAHEQQQDDQRGADQQPDDARGEATKKSDPISTGPQGNQKPLGNTDAKATAGKVIAEDGTVLKDRDGADGGDAQSSTGAPEASEGDERRWPNGAVPEDVDQYEHMLETKLSDFTVAADVSNWWKGKEQADLRKACGLTKDQFEAFQKKAEARYAELLKAAKAK